jgi:phosphate transport system substrate-binding protein
MKRVLSIGIFCLGLLALGVQPGLAGSSSLAPFDNMSGSISIAGGTAHIPVMKESAKRIMIRNPDISITVAGGGSGVGVQKVGEGLVDIGNTGRPISPQEKEKYGLESFAFAIDGVGLAVHPENPVGDLSSEQVQAVFAGEISSWNELGGPDRTINLYTRDEASGTRKVFWKKALDKGTIAVKANVVPSNGAMKVAISRDKAAIGYLSIGHMDDSIARVAVDGVSPTQENAIDGCYTIVRKLYMNTKGEPTPLAQAFIDYVQGPAGAEIVSESGFIPLGK